MIRYCIAPLTSFGRCCANQKSHCDLVCRYRGKEIAGAAHREPVQQQLLSSPRRNSRNRVDKSRIQPLERRGVVVLHITNDSMSRTPHSKGR